MSNFYEFRHRFLAERVRREKDLLRTKDTLARIAVMILNGVSGVSGLTPGKEGDVHFVNGMSEKDERVPSPSLTRYSPSGRKLRFSIRLIINEDKEGGYRYDLPISINYTNEDEKFIVRFLSERVEIYERGIDSDLCRLIWQHLQTGICAVN
ncbi:hypothetical protein WI73_00595 [Burkholderia ubonensis]|nr:hypothetical protein WI73_00595 [Burkholderia ubonensis]